MDAGNEKLFGDKLDAKNFEPNLKIEVDQKGKTFYFERGNNL